MTQFDLFGNPIEKRQPARREMIPLDFETHAVRMIMDKGVPWWVAADVCRAIGVGEAHVALRRLDDDEKGRFSIPTPSGSQDMLVVNEYGLYTLILSSRKQEAKRFKRWITHEVLPSIRKTGSYSLSQPKRMTVVQQRLGCDHATAKVRCEQIDFNKKDNGRLASEGAGRGHFRAHHNGFYRGQFGATARKIRKALGVKGHVTPLDRCGFVVLCVNLLAKGIASKQDQDCKMKVPLEDRPERNRSIAAAVSEDALRRLGDGYRYAIVEDPKRGKIIDVINARSLN